MTDLIVMEMDLTADGAAGDAVDVDVDVLTSFEELQVEGEPDLIVELIDLYLEDAPRRVAAMTAAVAAADEMSLRRAAHSLRGSSANLGARQVAVVCDEVERADGGDSFRAVRPLLDRLGQELEIVRRVFTAERHRRS